MKKLLCLSLALTLCLSAIGCGESKNTTAETSKSDSHSTDISTQNIESSSAEKFENTLDKEDALDKEESDLPGITLPDTKSILSLAKIEWEACISSYANEKYGRDREYVCDVLTPIDYLGVMVSIQVGSKNFSSEQECIDAAASIMEVAYDLKITGYVTTVSISMVNTGKQVASVSLHDVYLLAKSDMKNEVEKNISMD